MLRENRGANAGNLLRVYCLLPCICWALSVVFHLLSANVCSLPKQIEQKKKILFFCLMYLVYCLLSLICFLMSVICCLRSWLDSGFAAFGEISRELAFLPSFLYHKWHPFWIYTNAELCGYNNVRKPAHTQLHALTLVHTCTNTRMHTQDGAQIQVVCRFCGQSFNSTEILFHIPSTTTTATTATTATTTTTTTGPGAY